MEFTNGFDIACTSSIVGFDGTKYVIYTSLQSDNCQIVDANGTVVVEYTHGGTQGAEHDRNNGIF